MNTSRFWQIWVMLILFLPNLIKAQDTLSSAPKQNLQLNLNASGRMLRGTFNQTVFSPGLNLQLKRGKWTLRNEASYRYNNLGGAQVEDNWHELLTLSFHSKPGKAFPMGFYVFDTNLLFRVHARHLGGLGVGMLQNYSTHTDVRLDAGLGWESTRYDLASAVLENTTRPDPLRERPVVLARVIHSHTLFKEQAKLSNTVYYRQSLTERPDFYLVIRPQLSLKIVPNLSITFSYEYRYEHVHLSDLSATNTMLLAGLTYSLNSKKNEK